MKVLVIGSCAWDTIYEVGNIKEFTEDNSLWANSAHQTVGSTGAGKALCLDALGVDVTLVTSLGNDQYGQNIKEYFKETTVSILNLPVDVSIAHTNIMYNKGNRISLTTSFPTIEPHYNEKVENLIEKADFVYLNINNFAREYIPLIKKHKKLCIVDIHDYDPPNPYHQDFINAADILISSGVKIDNKNEFMRQEIEKGKKLVVVTLGSEGLIALDEKNNYYKLPGFNDLDYVDSNGAGDSFCSGLGYSYFKNNSVMDALAFGTICGGVSCSSKELYPKNVNKTQIDSYKIRFFKK